MDIIEDGDYSDYDMDYSDMGGDYSDMGDAGDYTFMDDDMMGVVYPDKTDDSMDMVEEEQ